MPTTYTGTPVLSTSITIPVDGDNANANSVNVSSKALMDMQTFLYQTYGQQMQSTSPIRMGSNDSMGTQLFILAIPVLAVNDTGVWKTFTMSMPAVLTGANVEGGGGFVANTFYYVYAFSNMGSLDFQISTTAPDQFWLYKQGDFGFKYLGSFKTDGAAHMYLWQKYDSQYLFKTGQSVGGGTTTTPTLLSTNNFIAPGNAGALIGQVARLQVLVNTIGAASQHTLSIGPDLVGGTGYTFVINPGSFQTMFVEVPVDSNRQISFKWNSVESGSIPRADFQLLGYYE